MHKLLPTIKFFIPLLIFVLLVVLLWRGLGLNPRQLPSTLIGKPAPEFHLPLLENPAMKLNPQVFKGHVSLVNVWASWCLTCRLEHPFLMDIARSNEIAVYGIDYKDNAQAAMQWLQLYGSPYRAVGFDENGLTTIDWGVYGTPETFLIDKHGIVRYRLIGAITPEIWQQQLQPWISELQKEN